MISLAGNMCAQRLENYYLYRFVDYVRPRKKSLLISMEFENELADMKECCLAIVSICLLDNWFLYRQRSVD